MANILFPYLFCLWSLAGIIYVQGLSSCVHGCLAEMPSLESRAGLQIIPMLIRFWITAAQVTLNRGKRGKSINLIKFDQFLDFSAKMELGASR